MPGSWNQVAPWLRRINGSDPQRERLPDASETLTVTARKSSSTRREGGSCWTSRLHQIGAESDEELKPIAVTA